MKKRSIPFILAVVLCVMQIPAFAASSEIDCSSSETPFTMVIKDQTGGAVAYEEFLEPMTLYTVNPYNDFVDSEEWSGATKFGKNAVFTVTNNSVDVIEFTYREYQKAEQPVYYGSYVDSYYGASYGLFNDANLGTDEFTTLVQAGQYYTRDDMWMEFANKTGAAFERYSALEGGDSCCYAVKKGETVTFQIPIQDYSLCKLHFGYYDLNGDYTTFNSYYGWSYTLMRNDAFASANKVDQPSINAVLSPQNFTVDGENIACEKYNIDGSNYFKLRDLAYVLNGTSKQFSVGWDNANNTVTIETGKPYTAVGGELTTGSDKSSTATSSKQTIMIDGKKVTDLSVYNIGGNNYFKLRDLGAYVNFDVDFDASTNTAIVTTTICIERNGGTLTGDLKGNVGNQYVEIVGVDETTSYEGEPVVLIYYDATNISDVDMAPVVVLGVIAYQDNIELEACYEYDTDGEYQLNWSRTVRPGVTIRVVQGFSFNKNGGDIRFKMYDAVGENLGIDSGALECISSADAFIGAPATPLEIKPITNPTWTYGLDSEGDMDGVYVSIDSAEIFEDFRGEEVFRVYVVITNNSNEDVSTLLTCAYQDGIQLSGTMALDHVESDAPLRSSAVRPGETRVWSSVYELRSDSPIEVEVHHLFNSNNRIGGIFEYLAAPSDS